MGVLWWLPSWMLLTAPAIPQVQPAVREVISLSDAAVAFSGVVLLYLARQVMHVKEKVGQLESLPKSVERIENHMQTLANTQTAQRVEIANLTEDVNQNRRKLDDCPYHGPDRRHPNGGTFPHDDA
jgi:hypothetical protein